MDSGFQRRCQCLIESGCERRVDLCVQPEVDCGAQSFLECRGKCRVEDGIKPRCSGARASTRSRSRAQALSVPHDADWRAAFSRKSGSSAAAVQRPSGHPYVAAGRSPTTILPPTPRPGDRIGGSLRRNSVRRVEAYNRSYLETNNEPSDDANDRCKNVSNNDSNDESYNERFRLRSRFRYGPLFSYRHTCRRSALHSERYFGRYFLRNNERYSDGLNRGFAARCQFRAGLGHDPARKQGMVRVGAKWG